MTDRTDKIDIENVKHPGQTRRVDREKYEAMRRAYLRVLPDTGPGMTPAEIQDRLTGHLPDELFPGGGKAGWWAKAVQLDLEAKGMIAREPTRPVRLRKVGRRKPSSA